MKTCRKGHEMTEANTGIQSNGYPFCKTCKRESSQRYRQRNYTNAKEKID